MSKIGLTRAAARGREGMLSREAFGVRELAPAFLSAGRRVFTKLAGVAALALGLLLPTSLLCVEAVAADAAVGFAAGSHIANPGETITVAVTVSNFQQVTSVQFTMAWDPAVLQYVGTGDYGLDWIGAANFGTARAGQVSGPPPARPRYYLDESVTLTAIPGRFFRFLQWSDGVLDSPRTITIGGNNRYTAVFTNAAPVVERVEVAWDRSFGGSSDDWGTSVVPAEDGGWLVGGYSRSIADGTKTSPNYGSDDLWVVKLSSAYSLPEEPLILVNGQFSATGMHAIPATNAIEVQIVSGFTNANVCYTLDGSEPDLKSTPYTGPLAPTGPLTVRAVAYTEDFSVSARSSATIQVVPLYSLALSTPGGGAVTVDPPIGPYLSNSVVTLSPGASNGGTFLGWTGDATGTDRPLAVVMDRDKDIQAAFGTALTTNVPVGGGYILLAPTSQFHPFGSTVQLSAVPLAGKYFLRWGGAPGTISDSPIQFTITNPTPTFSALFASLTGTTRSITLLVNGTGSVTRAPALPYYANGATVTLTAAPADVNGMVVRVDFLLDNMLVGSDPTQPFSLPIGPLAVGAYTLTARAVDDLGATATSQPVRIDVVAAPPAITTQPRNAVVVVEGARQWAGNL